jgi:hypothetical protein
VFARTNEGQPLATSSETRLLPWRVARMVNYERCACAGSIKPAYKIQSAACGSDRSRPQVAVCTSGLRLGSDDSEGMNTLSWLSFLCHSGV